MSRRTRWAAARALGPWLVAAVGGACGGAPVDAPGPAPAVSGASEEPAVRYVAEVGLAEARVELVATRGGFTRWTLDAPRFVRDVEVVDVRGAVTRPPAGEAPLEAAACAGPCRIRYRVDLAAAARALRDPERASHWHGAVFAPPTTWLLRPTDPPSEAFELVARAPEGELLLGLSEVRPGVFGASLDDLPEAPYGAAGALRRRDVVLGDARLEVAIAGPGDADLDDAIEAWVRRSGEAVRAYLGALPQPRAAVFVMVGEGSGVGHGTALGNGGASVLVRVGRDATPAAFARDWILVHELVHLGFPGLSREHSWLEEGLATYVEPIARAERGDLSPRGVFGDWVRDMPQGLPQVGDGGLDGTRSWGRTYWGGAVFWLLADVAIHEATSGERGLRDCLRGVLREGGDIRVRWPARRALEACDRAVGASVVAPLYDLHAERPVDVDLPALFASLGVRADGTLHDEAPRAEARRAILRPPRTAAP